MDQFPFPGYVFCRINRRSLSILTIPGAVGLVGFEGTGRHTRH
jgi:hypothetical protein